MLRRSVGVLATCALAAEALILPAGIAPASDKDAALAPSIINPKNRLIQLPCPACDFDSRIDDIENDREGNGDFYRVEGGAKSLALNFSVSADDERLELNGVAVYPPEYHSHAYLQGITIQLDQVSSTASDADIVSGQARTTPLGVTSSGLQIGSEEHVSSGGDVVVPIKFQIMGLENRPMDLDEVSIDLLKMANGELLILRLYVASGQSSLPFTPPQGPPPPPPGPMSGLEYGKECKMLPPTVCRVKNILEAKVTAIRHGRFGPLRPCPGRTGPPHHPSPDFKPGRFDLPGPPHRHHGRPHHMRPHGHHHHAHKHHFFHAFVRGLVAVLIPIMAGITVGLTVSLVGLLIGRSVGFFWRRVVRGGQRGQANNRTEGVDVDEGKILLLEDDLEALQVYEDAPAYEHVSLHDEKIEQR